MRLIGVQIVLCCSVAYSEQFNDSFVGPVNKSDHTEAKTEHHSTVSQSQKKSIDNILLAMKNLPSSKPVSVTPEKQRKIKKVAKSSKIKRNTTAKKYIKKSVKKKINKSTKNVTNKSQKHVSKKIITKKVKNRQRYCLGGSYKALARKAGKYDRLVSKYSKKYNVPKALIKAVITAESCFNSKAVSPKGAQGLMQLMPPTAQRFGIKDSFNPDSNIRGGTRYLKFLIQHFEEDLLFVIAAYNAGEGAVKKYKGVPPYQETRNYVSKVAALYKLYGQGSGELTLASVSSLSNARLMRTIFVPRSLPKLRFSPYKGRTRNISHGQCANRTSTRLRKSTRVESGNGVWQRTYRVKAGDTLMRVMQKTGVHKSKIRQMNGLSSRARLKAGQQLLVWECRRK